MVGLHATAERVHAKPNSYVSSRRPGAGCRSARYEPAIGPAASLATPGRHRRPDPYSSQRRSRPRSPPGRNARLLRRAPNRHRGRAMAGRRLVHRNPGALSERRRQAPSGSADRKLRRAHSRQSCAAIRSMARSRLRPSMPASRPRSRRAAPTSFLPSATSIAGLMMKQPIAGAVFAEAFRVLKPGGTLGVVEHRLPEEADDARQLTSGYVKVSTVRRLAEQAGFKLVESSEINANPKDTQRSSGGRMDPSAQPPPWGQGSREISGDRRKRPDDA